jgi:hypothetical protein
VSALQPLRSSVPSTSPPHDCQLQILMLKSGRHTVHFLLRETVPRGLGAPFRYGLADIQFEIARYLTAVLRTRGFISIGTGIIS